MGGSHNEHQTAGKQNGDVVIIQLFINDMSDDIQVIKLITRQMKTGNINDDYQYFLLDIYTEKISQC